MSGYNLYTGSYDAYTNFSYIKGRYTYFTLNTTRATLQNQQYFKMRAYLIPSSSYVTWITTGSLDGTGVSSGYPTSSLSDITVLPQFS
jgi:hypothetical protein